MEISMHKIGVISDTHGLLRPEVEQKLRGCEVILHGGDINNPAILDALNKIATTYAVRGNNDKEWASNLPETLSVELWGVSLFMVHNKKYIPKDMERVDVIIYGHSHKYEEKYLGERLLLNPGSCGPRRFTQPITFAILEITGDHSFHVEKIEIAHEGKVAGVKGRGKGVPEEAGHELTGRDMKKAVRAVMRDTDKKLSIPEIAARNGISEELTEQICRLYLTHPGVSEEGILGKMGL